MAKINSISLGNHENLELIPVCNDEKYLLDMHSYSILDEFYQYLEFDAFQSLEETRSYLCTLIDRSASDNCQYWFIKLPAEGIVVGTIGLHSLDNSRLSAEVGYGLSPNYQGRGLFSTSLQLVLEYAFSELGLTRIVARTDAGNKGSIKGLLRNGFVCEGVMRSYYRYKDGNYSDCSLFSKLCSEHKVK
jgi:ribosomal-protein-alanine N-acetyltransferase